jgi:hypothetical protein
MEFSRERGRKQGGHISEATFRDISFAKSSELIGGVPAGPIDVMSLRVA